MIDTFKKYLDRTNLSDNSKNAYMFAFKQFTALYGSVTKKNLTAYKVWLVDNFKPQTVNLRLRGMNCYLESVGKEKWKEYKYTEPYRYSFLSSLSQILCKPPK